MSFAKIKSYAKINIALNIVGKDTSLHKIETIVAFLSLHDDIFIKKIESKKHKIFFFGKFSKNIYKDNTISKLLEILDKKKLLNKKKFYIKVNKRIPNKAGLGGGSMNAANILRYFYKKRIIKIDKKNLYTISRLIGTDVILGLNPIHTILTSKNKIKRFKKHKNFYTLVVKPNFGCSTKHIYSKVRKFDKAKFNKPKKKMLESHFLKKMNNSLEPIVMSEHLKLNSIKSYLENLTEPVFVRMTGSGSALVAYFHSKARCAKAKKLFNKKYKNYWCIASKTI